MLRNDGSGHPTQGLYTLPTSLLHTGGVPNLLTLVDVAGARDVAAVRLVRSVLVPAGGGLLSPPLTWPPDKPSAMMGEVADCALV